MGADEKISSFTRDDHLGQIQNLMDSGHGDIDRLRYILITLRKGIQLVIYSKRKTIYFTVEPKLSINKKLGLIMRIKKIISHL